MVDNDVDSPIQNNKEMKPGLLLSGYEPITHHPDFMYHY